MKEPIYIIDHGDVSVYEKVSDACFNLEAIDIVNQEYEGYDSEGRLLRLSVNNPKLDLWGREISIIIEPAEEVPSHVDQVRKMLIEYLDYFKYDKEWLSMASLEELVIESLNYKRRI